MMARRQDWTPVDPPPLSSLRLATPRGWVHSLDAAVGAVWSRVAGDLPEVEFPPLQQLAGYALDILSVEAAAIHRPWLATVPHLYGKDVLERLRAALTVEPRARAEALQARGGIQHSVAQAMAGLDAVLLPTTAVVAPPITAEVDIEPLTRFTRALNYTGQPVMSLPVPTPGLPVGIQVVGHLDGEAALARTALSLERGWA